MHLALLSIVITILVPLSAIEYLLQYRGGVDFESLIVHQPLLCVTTLLSFGLSIWLLAKEAQKRNVSAPIESKSEVLSLLCLLQSKGRFIDFVMEKIEGHSDEEIVGASRAVHAGCREVILSSFSPKTISELTEGETISDVSDTRKFKFVGKVGKPPYSGVLAHAGWIATKIELPKVSNSDSLVIAPAEVEVG
jgi:hypothetical protein